MQADQTRHLDAQIGKIGTPPDAMPTGAHTPAPATSDTTPSFVSSAIEAADTSVAEGPVAGRQASAAQPEQAARNDAHEPLPFARLGHYEIVRQIGRGGMGDVYLGYEQALD